MRVCQRLAFRIDECWEDSFFRYLFFVFFKDWIGGDGAEGSPTGWGWQRELNLKKQFNSIPVPGKTGEGYGCDLQHTIHQILKNTSW
jgi:hypothetical protein